MEIKIYIYNIGTRMSHFHMKDACIGEGNGKYYFVQLKLTSIIHPQLKPKIIIWILILRYSNFLQTEKTKENTAQCPLKVCEVQPRINHTHITTLNLLCCFSSVSQGYRHTFPRKRLQNSQLSFDCHYWMIHYLSL